MKTDPRLQIAHDWLDSSESTVKGMVHVLIQEALQQKDAAMIELVEKSVDEILCQRHRTVYEAMQAFLKNFKKN